MLAVVEKFATLQTVDYLEQRAARGSREKLLAVLVTAPDAEPDKMDRPSAVGPASTMGTRIV